MTSQMPSNAIVFDNLKLSHFSTVRSHKSPFPTYKLVKGDPVLQAAFEKELEFIKKLIMEEIVLLHVDETHVRAYLNMD